MLETTLLGPISAVYVLGISSILVPLAASCPLILYILTDVSSEIGLADVISAASATGLVGSYIVMLLYMTCYRSYESYFTSTPWLEAADSDRQIVGNRSYQKRCPFTGLRPSMRCPSCQCRVHQNAFRGPEPGVQFAFGETVLRWDNAKVAIDTATSTEQGRAALDEALDYRGNMYTQRLTACCIGCATWQKCFNLAPRLSLSLATAALFFAYVPWGLLEFLDVVGAASVFIKAIAGCTAVALATTALLVQVRALGRSLAFLAAHADKMPTIGYRPQLPHKGLAAAIIRMAFATPWDPLM